MPAKRHQQVERAILSVVLKHSDHLGYPAGLPSLASTLRQTFGDIDNQEIVNTLKRLRPKYLTLWKWNDQHRRFLQYPDEIGEDEEFFYRADFRLRQTPETDPYLQTIAAEIDPPEVTHSMTTIDEAGRKARFDRWEKLGLDRIKSDLVQTGGIRDVGGPPEVRELAWEWVRMKEAEASAASQPLPAATLTLTSEARLAELRALASAQFDFKKLIRLCEEINMAYSAECYFATAMLIRGLLDHVPPVFGKATFSEVANYYAGGGKSFKDTMHHLENASRKVADAHLHMPVRKSETLPTAQQVNCGQQLDVLLSEIVRITK